MLFLNIDSRLHMLPLLLAIIIVVDQSNQRKAKANEAVKSMTRSDHFRDQRYFPQAPADLLPPWFGFSQGFDTFRPLTSGHMHEIATAC